MSKEQIVPEAVNLAGVPASFVNQPYGEHPRNVFDIWIADRTEPSPLVIYIHGGGFVGGDKSRYYESEDWLKLLDAGISVATINYRFMNEPPYGILASMHDARRCLQFIRYHAEKYNVDKTRIACSGGSAGAGTSLWLAFSDDRADLLNPDPVLRESTRLTCAAAFSTQCTYDILQWESLLGFPLSQDPGWELSVARVMGFQSADGIDLEGQTAIRKELDFLGMMRPDSPPFFAWNHFPGGVPTNESEIQHHPLHAKILLDKARAVGCEAVVYAPEIGIASESGMDVVDFFCAKLK